jgi:hypothetical protein
VVPLSYDDLPPGSDIRRERDADGVVRIIVPAGEPPPAALRQAQYHAVLLGALIGGVPLVLASAGLVWAIRSNRISGGPLITAWLMFGVFCAAAVMMAASVLYFLELDALRAGREQMTAVAVSPAKLIIETAGPFGDAGHAINASEIVQVRVRMGSCYDRRRRRNHTLRHLRCHLVNGSAIDLLPGRERAELAVIAAILREVLQTPNVRPA